jgi:hypothetical protein
MLTNIAFQIFFRTHGVIQSEWDTSSSGLADDNSLGKVINTIQKNKEVLLVTSKEVCLEATPEKPKYMSI